MAYEALEEIKKAEEKAEEILFNAKNEAEKIIADAKLKAKEMLEKCEEELSAEHKKKILEAETLAKETSAKTVADAIDSASKTKEVFESKKDIAIKKVTERVLS